MEEDSGIVNLWAWRKGGESSAAQVMKDSMNGLLKIGKRITLHKRLDTICSACKENDSTCSEVVHIVVCLGSDPGTGVDVEEDSGIVNLWACGIVTGKQIGRAHV